MKNKFDVFDFIFLIGAGFVVFGSGLIYKPLAVIEAGVFLIWASIAIAKDRES